MSSLVITLFLFYCYVLGNIQGITFSDSPHFFFSYKVVEYHCFIQNHLCRQIIISHTRRDNPTTRHLTQKLDVIFLPLRKVSLISKPVSSALKMQIILVLDSYLYLQFKLGRYIMMYSLQELPRLT